MSSTSPALVVLEFVDAINARDSKRLAALMTLDHRFVDSLGREHSGVDVMESAWEGYFETFPDYEIRVDERYAADDVVYLFGECSGTLDRGGRRARADHWSIPSAWRATVSDGRVASWQIYGDTTPVQRIMSRPDERVRAGS